MHRLGYNIFFERTNMELKDFLEKSVSDIVEAVSSLKSKYNTSQVIEPDNFCEYEPNPIAPLEGHSIAPSDHKIDFDIAVTTTENNNKKNKGELKISVIGGSSYNEKNCSNEQISRIKFSVPFCPEHIKK